MDGETILREAVADRQQPDPVFGASHAASCADADDTGVVPGLRTHTRTRLPRSVGGLRDEVGVVTQLGRIQPHGVAHPLSVHTVGGDIVVYAVHQGMQKRVVTIQADTTPMWHSGWFTDDAHARAAIVKAALAVREAAARKRRS